MKYVFVDCEYTSTHHHTTLISIGLVSYNGRELYITLNDYNKDQLSDWVKVNVMATIDESKSVSSKQACLLIAKFLEDYSNGEKISIITAGKTFDNILLFQLWHTAFPELKYFSFERYLPDYLRHRRHFDLDTIFFMCGYDPDEITRESFVDESEETNRKHDALYDAKIVRKCFLKLQENNISLLGSLK